MSELEFSSALRQARLIREGELSPVELVDLYLGRIDKDNDRFNAYVFIDAESARREASRAEMAVAGGDELPPFHGVPIAIKCLTEVAGWPATRSSRAFANRRGEVDAAVVKRLKSAGFVPLGLTNASEFGTVPMTESELHGACRNPWDVTLSPAGSSGGAGAALAAGLCPIAQGSDGGGSIRAPSAWCGTYGLKPARGRVSQAPREGEHIAGWSTPGPMTRSVADAAAMLDVIAGYETGDPYWAPEPPRPFGDELLGEPGALRVGFAVEAPNGAPVDPEAVRAVEDAARLLESLGHHVEGATPDWTDEDLTVDFVTVWQTISAWNGSPDPADLDPHNRVLAEAARATSSADYVKAQNRLHALARRIVAYWERFDILLTPSMTQPPLPIGWLLDEEDPWVRFAKAALLIPFLAVFNLTGQPAASLPLHWTTEGLPLGVQLVGPPAGEALVLSLSAQLEEARPWADRHPASE